MFELIISRYPTHYEVMPDGNVRFIYPEDRMEETTQSICEFFKEVAGSPTPIRGATRANEELAELLSALSEHKPLEEALVEAADVVIVLTHLCGCLGFDLWELVEKKMEKNRARTWKSQGDGTAYHIKESGK